MNYHEVHLSLYQLHRGKRIWQWKMKWRQRDHWKMNFLFTMAIFYCYTSSQVWWLRILGEMIKPSWKPLRRRRRSSALNFFSEVCVSVVFFGHPYLLMRWFMGSWVGEEFRTTASKLPRLHPESRFPRSPADSVDRLRVSGPSPQHGESNRCRSPRRGQLGGDPRRSWGSWPTGLSSCKSALWEPQERVSRIRTSTEKEGCLIIPSDYLGIRRMGLDGVHNLGSKVGRRHCRSAARKTGPRGHLGSGARTCAGRVWAPGHMSGLRVGHLDSAGVRARQTAHHGICFSSKPRPWLACQPPRRTCAQCRICSNSDSCSGCASTRVARPLSTVKRTRACWRN